MKTRSKTFLVIAALSLVSSLAYADGEQCDSAKHNKAEAQPSSQPAPQTGTTHLEQRFGAADVNHDNGLDKSEAGAMPMLSAYFDQIDTNKDGKVTRQEYFDAMPLLHRAKQIDVTETTQAL